MNKLDQLFLTGKKNLLNMYCTAGYPALDSTVEVMLALQKNGADMIEIGMPYSDPIADGPVIQESNKTALQNGMNMKLLFEQLKEVQDRLTIPVILMGYLNPVLQYGMEKFCRDASEAGVHAIILPDLPMFEFKNEYQALFKNYGLHVIFLITPEMSVKRIREADGVTSGFLYVVSSSSTTGSNEPGVLPQEYLKKLQALKLSNPLLVGFGIKDKAGFEQACRHSAGGIIGSAYIQALGSKGNIGEVTRDFIKLIKDIS